MNQTSCAFKLSGFDFWKYIVTVSPASEVTLLFMVASRMGCHWMMENPLSSIDSCIAFIGMNSQYFIYNISTTSWDTLPSENEGLSSSKALPCCDLVGDVWSCVTKTIEVVVFGKIYHDAEKDWTHHDIPIQNKWHAIHLVNWLPPLLAGNL